MNLLKADSGMVIICTLLALSVLTAPVRAQPDIAGEYDFSGHAGVTFTSWAGQGEFYGFIIPVGKLDASKVDFHSATAEGVMGAEFLGYSRERLIGVHAGISRYLGYTDLVASLGAGLCWGRRFRLYCDEDGMYSGRDFYVRDRARTRFMLDLEASLAWRGDDFIAGIGVRLATRSIFVRIGFPAAW